MVKRIKWKDFVLEGNKPNLIKNGWDSFSPYRSGKNYVENWDFSGDILIWNERYVTGKIENQMLVVEAIGNNPQDSRIERAFNVDSKENIIRVKARGTTGIEISRFENAEFDKSIVTFSGDEWVVVEVPFTVIDLSKEVMVRIYITDAEKGETLEIDWIQITPVDNQHLVLEKTPLGNGLTRIQTWGGNHILKLNKSYSNTDEVFTQSMYVSKINIPFIFRQHQTNKNIVVDKPGFYEISGSRTTSFDNIFQIRTLEINDNLDFIASDPQIVEGDVPNAVMVVDTLDDGREHVQVLGANPETKLVYKGGSAIIGEPYVIESEIENLGGQLQMETTLDSTGQVIDKGINQVNIKGTTDSKDFEIGVKLRDGTI